MNAAFLKYWSTDGPVFARVPDPAALFLSHGLRQKLDRLALACEQRQALVALTGDPGAGKTTVLRWLFKALPTDAHEVLLTTLVRRENGPGWLTPRLAELMGVKVLGLSLDNVIRATAARMDELIEEKRSLVVAVDAAHLAQEPAALEEIAAFLNLQAFAGRCLTFVLAGTDALLDTLAATPELSGKLALHAHLAPLTRDETAAYIAHRLAAAGVTAAFEDQAVDFLHLKTRGVMAAIDVAADNCLTEAFQKSLRRIGPDIVKLAAASLAGGAPRAERTLVPFTRAATLAESDDDRSMSLTRLAAGTPPPGGTPAPAPLPHDPKPEPRPESPPRDSASIKLASLFKSDGAKPKPS